MQCNFFLVTLTPTQSAIPVTANNPYPATLPLSVAPERPQATEPQDPRGHPPGLAIPITRHAALLSPGASSLQRLPCRREHTGMVGREAVLAACFRIPLPVRLPKEQKENQCQEQTTEMRMRWDRGGVHASQQQGLANHASEPQIPAVTFRMQAMTLRRPPAAEQRARLGRGSPGSGWRLAPRQDRSSPHPRGSK